MICLADAATRLLRRARRGNPGGEPREMPDSPLKDALQLIHFHLLFNDKDGMTVDSAASSIREKVEISPRRALRAAVRTGLVEKHTDFMGRRLIRRSPRSDEVLRRIYGKDGPPTREGLLAGARERREAREAEHARLEALREAGRPREHNTAGSLPAWVP